MKIPMGSTTTYGELGAKVAGLMDKETMSAQAIGGAVGHNPISLIIPCHRVVGAKGQLTGYAGGVDKKAAILTHEGVKLGILIDAH
jgi:methylated-DNA-[protein]-cysteine S-methyltransferase